MFQVDSKFMESPEYPKNVPGLTSIPDFETLVSMVENEKKRKGYEFLFRHFVFEIRPYHMVTIPAPGDYRVIFYARLTPECIGEYAKSANE